MSEKPPLELIVDLVVEMARVERQYVQPGSRFIDFGIDSARAMEVVVDLEETYAVSIPDQDLADLKTIQDLATYIERRQAS